MADYTSKQIIDDPERDLRYLAAKRSTLSAGGTFLDGNYYSIANSTVDLVETTYSQGRLSIALSSKTFGSQSQILVPNSSFVGDTYLVLTLPNLLENQTLCRGWGYAIINSISFLFGSSNVSQLTINGQSMWAKISQQCECEEKRSELFRLGGQEYLSPIMRMNPTTGLPERDPDAVITATVLLSLPWSSASGLFSKIPFDTNCLNNPLTIQVQFNQAKAIYGGAGIIPAGFLRAEALLLTGDLTNKEQSLRNKLAMNPELSMLYPFIHCQSFTPAAFYGSKNIATPVNIPVQAFINADLLAMTVHIIKSANLSPLNNANANPFDFDPIKNVMLTWNGTILYNAPEDSWKCMSMRSSMGPQYFQNSIIVPNAAGIAPFMSNPKDCYPLHIDFSRIRSCSFEGKFQNVFRIANQTLTLMFNTSEGPETQYQAFFTFYYNGVAQVQQGQTSVYFD